MTGLTKLLNGFKHMCGRIKKLTVPTYFEALITNMMMKILANLIFKVKNKKNVFNKFFNFMSINIHLGKIYFLENL